MRYRCAMRAAWMVLFAAALASAAGAQSFVGWEDHPGLYFYLVQPAVLWEKGELSVDRKVVRDHVSGEHALRLTFDASKTSPGIIVYRPPGAAVPDRGDFGALSFWMKGDGSGGVGVVGVGEGRDADPRAQFLLKSTAWQPVRIDWRDFDPPVTDTRVPSLFFTVTPETKRPASFIVDRIALARSTAADLLDEEVRRIGEAAAKLPDADIPEHLAPFTTHRDRLAAFRQRLAEEKPVRVLLLGDRVSQGAGLWNVPPALRSRFLFWGVLKDALERQAPGSIVTPMFFDHPADAALQVDALLRNLRFDLVVVQFSTSTLVPDPRSFRTASRRAFADVFAACRREKVDVVVLAVPPVESRFKRVDEAATLLAEAGRAEVSATDFGRLVGARGKGFEGQFYVTDDQLNVEGHRLAARLLTSMLIEP